MEVSTIVYGRVLEWKKESKLVNISGSKGIYWIKLLEPSGNFTYPQLEHSQILRGAHIAFMCFVRISGQTTIISLYKLTD
jgi:hypothetical protein